MPPPDGFNVPLVHRVYEFYKLFHGFIRLFPKTEKHSLGQKIESLILELLELILLAVSLPSREKTGVLQRASLKIDLLKILIRLAKDIKAIDDKKYIRLEEELQEIGKMTGGWIRSLKF